MSSVDRAFFIELDSFGESPLFETAVDEWMEPGRELLREGGRHTLGEAGALTSGAEYRESW
jgi:hypothetical protein